MSAVEHHPESGHRADADRVIEIVERYAARYGARNVDADLPKTLSWDSARDREHVRRAFQKGGGFDEPLLPGFGELGDARTARDDCGDAHPFVCDSCGHAVEFGRTCSQSVCSRCGNAWVRDAAIQKAGKLRRIKWEKYDTSGLDQLFHHTIFSFRLGWYYDLARAGHSLEEAQELTRKCIKEVLDELRAQGLLVRHSFRGVRDDGTLKEEGDDRGKWKERLFSGRDWHDDVREDLAWMPHYHSFLVADWIQGDQLTKRVERETGLIIHRIADDDGKSLANDGAMARAATYGLSHTDIDVNPNGNNRAAAWWVGAFDGDPIKSTSRFSPTDRDLEWAGAVVREHARKTLGLSSGTTDCGASIPPVDDPDELARRVGEEIGADDVGTERILQAISKGHIRVDTTGTAGSGGDLTVRDAFGEPVRLDRDGADTIPALPDHPATEQIDTGETTDHLEDDDGDATEECDGTLLPLEVARRRDLLDELEQCGAPHVDEARDADQEWNDDLDPWRTQSPDGTPGVTGVG